MSETENKKSIAWEFFELCYSWKKFIAITTGVFTVLGVILALVLPKEYEGVASVLPSKNMGLLGLLGGSGGSSVSKLAQKFAPLMGGSESQIGSGYSYLAILNSREAMLKVVDKFDLLKVYDIKDSMVDAAIKELRSNVDFQIDKYGAVVVKVLDRSPKRSAAMANYFVKVLNNMNGFLSSEDARNMRMVIESRYLKNVSDLKNAEDSMKVFQQKYGVFSLPEQAKASVSTGAELESQLILAQVRRSVFEKQLAANSPEIVTLDQQIAALRQKINDLKTGKGMAGTENSGVLVPFKEMPARAMEYLDLYRQIEIQTKLMEIVYPLYEQAKLEEARETPTVLVLDHAVPPVKKSRPMRSLIVISAFVLGLALSIVLVLFVRNGIEGADTAGELRREYYEISVGLAKRLNKKVLN